MSKEPQEIKHTEEAPELAVSTAPIEHVSHDNRHKISEIVLIIVTVAWAALALAGQTTLATAVLPFYWILAAGLVLWCHQPVEAGRSAILFAAVSFAAGLLATYVGQETQSLFGAYAFTEVLGYKLVHTPVVIGVVWVLVNYISGATIKQYFPFAWPVIQAVMSALLVAVLVFTLEHVAVRLDLWQWTGGGMPTIQNYLAWFDISFLLQLLFSYLVPFVNNRTAPVLVLLLTIAHIVEGAGAH